MESVDHCFLSASIALLDKVLATSTDHIYVFDRAGNFLYASPAGLAALGLQAEHVLGRTWCDLNFPSEIMEPYDAQRELVFQTGMPVKGETSFPTLQGIRHYEYIIAPILSADGTVVAVTHTSRDITDHKVTQAILEAKQAQIQQQLAEIETLYQSAPIGLAFLDADLRFVRLNQRLADMNGLPITAHLGRTVREVIPALADTAEHLLRPVLETGEPLLNIEIIGETPAQPGVQRIWLESFLPLKDGDRVIGINTVCEEITERKRAEQTLAKELLRIKTLFETSFDGIVVLDAQGRVLDANPRFAAMLGYTLEETAKLTVFDWDVQFSQADLAQLMQDCLSHRSGMMETRHRRKDGSIYDVEISYHVTEWEGQILRFCACRDISDRKRAEAERQQVEANLQEREMILRLFAQYAPAGIAMFDREMRYVMTSQRWADDYHIGSYTSLIGRSHYDVFPEIPQWWKQVHRRCLAGAIDKCDEDLFVRADGTQQWLRWEVRPWHRASGDIGGIIVFSEDITERKRVETSVAQLNQELQQKVTELQTLLDVIPIGIGIANDPECHHIQVNPAFAQALDLSTTANASLTAPETERPTHFTIYQHGRELAATELPLQYAAAHGVEVRDFEVDVVWNDGTVITLLEYAAPLLDDQGQIRGSVGAFLDISERKRAEADLQKYKDIFQFAEYGLGISKGANLVLVNPAFAKMHGYTMAEMVNRPIFDLFPPECHAETKAFIQQLDQVGHLSHESYHIRKDGTVFPILLDITVVKDAQGNSLYRIVTAFDITDRKRAEVALRESEERYRILVQNFPNGAVLLFDQDLRYVLAAGQGMADVGLNRALMEGKMIWEVFDRQICERLEPLYRQTLAGHTQTTEVLYDDRIYQTNFLPLYNDQGRVKLGMVVTQDITVQKQAEQALRTSRDELERQVQARTAELRQLTDELQQSNQELEEFAYVASHDLQEPLRAVTSFTQMLAKRYQGQLDTKADTYIEFIVDGATRMQQLIRDLLAYSRTGRYELKWQPVDCNTLLERVKKDLQVAIAETNAVIIADTLPTITADPNQIANLLLNLISNSLKYRSDATPQVQITAQKQRIDADWEHPTTSISPSTTGTHVEWVFAIQDNGIGIDPQYAERIFGIFQRLHTSDEYSGTGLGLAICRKIVERHGGRIWVESELGQGATFFFTIPLPARILDDTQRPITSDPTG